MINNEFEKTRLKIAGLFFAIFFLLISVINIVNISRQNFGIGRLEEVKGMGGIGKMINDEIFKQRLEEQRERVITDAIVLELSLSVLGAIISYLLSDYVLRPIKLNIENQRRFLSFASHELKTPITTISLLSESDKSEKMKSINEEAEKLNLLTSKYLEIITTDKNREVKEVDIEKVIASTIDLFRKTINQEDIKVENVTPKDIKVRTYEDDLKIVLRNIIENATKYVGDPKYIKISSTLLNDVLTVTVINSISSSNYKKGYGLGSEIIKYHSSQSNFKYSFNKTEKEGISTLEIKNIN